MNIKPKTPLPWEPADTSLGLIRMYPEDYNFAVHAANRHEKMVGYLQFEAKCGNRKAWDLLKEIGELEE